MPSLGRVEILGHCPVDRVRDSFEARDYMRAYRDTFMVTDEDAEKELDRWLWADPDYEVPNTDSRLSVTNEWNFKVPVRDLVVYEVARHRNLPDDTKRDHEGIYRRDIVDVRNPVAQHLAAASAETVLALIARIRELEARETRVAEVAEHLDDLIQESPGATSEEDTDREETRIADLSFASGAIKAALDGMPIQDHLFSDRMEKDRRGPARCVLLNADGTSRNPV